MTRLPSRDSGDADLVTSIAPAPDGVVHVSDPRLDEHHMMFAGIACPKPLLTVTMVATMFFGKSAHWIRLHEREGHLVLDGVPVGVSRKEAGARIYTLADVELICHALASRQIITGARLNDALLMLRTAGRVWGYL